MKTKTQELTGAALDWAVAKAYGMEFSFEEFPLHEMTDWQPSTDWRLGGLLIEQAEISIRRTHEATGWTASKHLAPATFFEHGPNPLIAAMRCYVASVMGDEVEVPEELK